MLYNGEEQKALPLLSKFQRVLKFFWFVLIQFIFAYSIFIP